MCYLLHERHGPNRTDFFFSTGKFAGPGLGRCELADI